jgi:alpha,alpha-trehalose phosphorylase
MAATRPGYPVEGWRITEEALDPAILARSESVFSLGNGYLGLRGNLEEGFRDHAPGTFINGFYEEQPIFYEETASGFASDRQVMLNVADGKRIRLWVGGEPFNPFAGELLMHRRGLDLRGALLSREARWRSAGGVEIELRSRRLVSQTRRNLAAIEYTVRVVRGRADLRVESAINCRVANRRGGTDPRIGASLGEQALTISRLEAGGLAGASLQRTGNSGLAVACAMVHVLAGPVAAAPATAADGQACVNLSAPPEAGVLRFTKYLAYCTSFDHPDDGLLEHARTVAEDGAIGFEALLAEQRGFMDAFWEVAGIDLEGDEAIRQGLRFNLFQLLQSAGRDGRTSLAAKGLSGEGYDGHYFWDSEIYALPFFVRTRPEQARALVRYRFGILDQARKRAAELGQRGALFPWRTINGKESSAYFPAGTAQYHIDGDIAFALRNYVESTGDRGILLEGGAELVFETARMWADLGHYSPPRGGAFCIDEVTGPDEYSALVNNNLYTNFMARMNLAYGAQLAAELEAQAGEAFRDLAGRIRLDPAEPLAWRRAAEAMCLPYDRQRGIHAQDDQFLSREVWDFAGTPADRYPLLLHYHPLVIYRHQVLKQPDVVLAQVLFSDQFSMADKKRNFEYYDPLTTGDSSLAACIQSIATAELGQGEDAYGYFTRTARMDLDDVNGDCAHGLHMAAMGGTWMSVVYGFCGLRDQDGRLRFAPRLPQKWTNLRLRLAHQGRLLELAVDHDRTTYTLLAGAPMELSHRGRTVRLALARPVAASNGPNLECVIFDLDGVLTSTSELHCQAWAQLAGEQGWRLDRELNERLKGVGRMECLEIILEHNRIAAGRLSWKQKELLAERKNAGFKELIKAITPADALPGIRVLLARLRAEGIKLAVASMSHNAWEILGRLGLRDLFDAVVDPAGIVKGKPDPEVFFKAAEAVGVPFGNCAGVEDAVAGVQAVRAAGMFTIGIGAGLPGTDWLLPDTSGLTFEALAERARGWSAPLASSRG